jgi:hypothetical protein
MTKKQKNNLRKLMEGTLPPEPCKCKKIKGKHNLDDHCAAYTPDLPPCKLCEKYGNTPNAKTRAAMAEPRDKQIVVELDDLLSEIKTIPKSKMMKVKVTSKKSVSIPKLCPACPYCGETAGEWDCSASNGEMYTPIECPKCEEYYAIVYELKVHMVALSDNEE